MNRTAILALVGITLAAAACSGDATGSGGEGGDGGGTPSGDRVYTGTATVQTRYQLSTFGSLNGQTYSYTFPVQVSVDEPRSGGGIRESNPVSLFIAPTRQSGDYGEFMVSSSLVVAAPSGGELLLQYWRLQLSGGTIAGQLSDTHTREAAAANTLMIGTELARGSFIPFPGVMAQGTQLSGALDANRVEITIQGQALGSGSIADFAIQVSAQR